MKALIIVAVPLLLLSLPLGFAQSTGSAKTTPSAADTGAPNCTACAASTNSSHDARDAVTKPIPGTNETMVVGKIENLVPIGVLTVLGREKCSAEAVNWALQQGSSFDDIERTLRTIAAMQKLDCFKNQFGPEVNSRMEKPLAAANEALAQARTRAAK